MFILIENTDIWTTACKTMAFWCLRQYWYACRKNISCLLVSHILFYEKLAWMQQAGCISCRWCRTEVKATHCEVVYKIGTRSRSHMLRECTREQKGRARSGMFLLNALDLLQLSLEAGVSLTCWTSVLPSRHVDSQVIIMRETAKQGCQKLHCSL
jgi:hypothetical protein